MLVFQTVESTSTLLSMQDGECKMAGLTKKGKTYYALFSISGQTKWIRIGNMPLQDARIALRKLEAQYDKQKLGILELKPITLSKFSAVYLEDSRVNKAHETWKRDRTSVKTLLSFFGSHLLDSIDSKSIERYKSYRQRQGVTNRTINIELLCLSSMMKKALESNNLLSLPKIKKLKETKKPPRFLTKEELAKLIDTQNPWLRYILLVLRNAGLRSGQLKNLRLCDADFNQNTILVLNTKGNDYHTVPMNPELRATLLYLADNYVSPQGEITEREKHQMEYFFCNPNGKAIGSFKTAFYKGVEKAGLKNVTPHTLRHTFASHLVMSGVDLPTVKELLGHKSIITTMIYAHLSDEHKAKAVRKLSWAKPELKLAKD